jgi:hypothetical protein
MSRRTNVLSRATLATVVIAVCPTLVHACASCTGGDGPRVQMAFLGATAFMTLLPLGLIGAGILWLRRGGREWLAREFEDRDAWTPPEEPRPADEHPVTPNRPAGS